MQPGESIKDIPTHILLIGEDADLECLTRSITHLWSSYEIEHHRTVGKTITIYGKKSRQPTPSHPDCIILGSDDPCAMRCKAMRRIRTQTTLERNPLIVLSDGEGIQDIETYLSAGAAFTVGREKLRREASEIANIVTEYWLKSPIPDAALV